MKNTIVIVLFLLFTSCDYIDKVFQKQEKSNQPIIASVDDVNLYLSDVIGVVPPDMSKQDSLVLMKGYIASWAKQQLLLQKAKQNVSGDKIEELVKAYRQSLYINDYKEKLIKQQLDTLVNQAQIADYYEKNKENFKLTEDIIQIKYLIFEKEFINRDDVVKRFKSDKETDLEELELNSLNFKDYQLRKTSWMTYEQVLRKIPLLKTENKENLLKKSKFIEKEDNIEVYLVIVKDILRRNNQAPMSHVTSNIKELILHKRKYKLIIEIEKTLINDAIENNTFKEY